MRNEGAALRVHQLGAGLPLSFASEGSVAGASFAARAAGQLKVPFARLAPAARAGGAVQPVLRRCQPCKRRAARSMSAVVPA